jgi:aminoglycoside 3-N-acetyltransferase
MKFTDMKGAQMIDFFRALTPKPLLEAFRSFKKNRIRNKLKKQAESGLGYNKEALMAHLSEMGITSGDTLLVHCAFSSIGYVHGGPEAVINAMLDTIGPNGHLLMPASPVAKLQYDYLKTHQFFDVLDTPSAMGALSEWFRKMPGVRRSEHPTESVCAFGPQADTFVKDHFGQPTPYNEHSPYYKVAAAGGKILIIGRTVWVATSLHTLEDAVADFKFPVYADEWFEVTVKGYDRISRTMKTRAHNPEMSLSRQCGGLTPVFESAGVLKQVKFGEAQSVLLDAKGMFDTMVKEYRERGVTMYTPNGS